MIPQIAHLSRVVGAPCKLLLTLDREPTNAEIFAIGRILETRHYGSPVAIVAVPE